MLHEYYLTLYRKIQFENTLKKIGTQQKVKKKVLIAALGVLDDTTLEFVKVIAQHLEMTGLKVICQTEFDSKKLKQADKIIIIVHKNLYGDNHQKLTLSIFSRLAKKNLDSPGIVIPFLLDEEGKRLIPKYFKKDTWVKLQNREFYFEVLLLTLERLFTLSNAACHFMDEFNSNYNKLLKPLHKFERQVFPKLHPKSIFSPDFSSFIKKYLPIEYEKIMLMGMFMIVSLALVLALSISNLDIVSQPYAKQQNQIKKGPTQSDLTLPHKANLLQRPQIIEAIGKKLNQQSGIRIAILVGIGGAGKTTLARQYARIQNAPVKWEINAETKGAIQHSFEDLATILAKTEAQKREVRIAKQIKNADERSKKFLFIVKKSLRSHPNWILIYDNVESLKKIQTYFPTDPETWGAGTVLITTRDKNIKNSPLINANNIINVPELSSSEKYTLFTRIVYGNKSSRKPPQKEEINSFLKNIPSFPLDITTASYYIKDTHISFSQYLQRTQEMTDYFEEAKESLLKELTDYTKTRYGLVTLTIKKIIDQNPDYKKLLLFVSLLDSQNIPTDMLKQFIDNRTTVEKFIRQLRKHSFITSEQHIGNLPTFSIHRSTQAIVLAHLKKIMDLEKDRSLITSFVSSLEDYMVQLGGVENLHGLAILLSHTKSFLDHKTLLTDLQKWSLEAELGQVHYALGNYQAEKSVKEALQNLRLHREHDSLKFARAVGTLGCIYMDLGRYEESEGALKETLEIYEKELGPEHPKSAWVFRKLGIINFYLGNYKKSKAFAEQTWRVCQKVNKLNRKDHLKITLALILLGGASIGLGEYIEAKKSLELAMEIYKKNLGQDYAKDDRIHWVLTHLGRAYNFLGDYKKAKEFLKKGFTLRKKRYGEKSVRAAWAGMRLGGECYNRLGYSQEAEKLVRESLAIYRKAHGDNHIVTAMAMAHLGSIYTNTNQLKKAEPLLTKALEVYYGFYGDNHMETAWVHRSSGHLYTKLKKFTKAKDHLNRALQICEKNFGAEHIRTAEVLKSLGDVYLAEKQLELAEKTLQKAFTIYEKNNHPDKYACLESLGDLHLKKFENIANITKYYKASLNALKKHFPKDCPHTLRVQNKLDRIMEASLTKQFHVSLVKGFQKGEKALRP